jgi:hypothetical protein
MTLYHHDNRPYEIAAGDAAEEARRKIEAMIDEGRIRGASVMEKVEREVPEDILVKSAALEFTPFHNDDLGVEIKGQGPRDRMGLHKNARSQACHRVHLPEAYVNSLLEKGQWGRELVAANLNELYKHEDARHLLRTYNGTVRGFLSDRFRRMDSRPLLEAFAGACKKVGAVPVNGYATDTKVALKAMIPHIFEPVKNEVMAFGLVWENSDYGNGAMSIRAFLLRLWCTNYAITDTAIRQVHLGRRLDDALAWSDRTHKLDTEALASAIDDIVVDALSEDRTTQYCNAIIRASLEKVEGKDIGDFLKRNGVLKGEAEEIIKGFNTPDVERLPPGNTKWRMSNAISLFAGGLDDNERKLDLMKVAGAVLAA